MSREPAPLQVAVTDVPRPTAELAARRRVSSSEHSLGVRNMFARVSPTYDKLNHLLSFGIDRRWRARVLDVLAERATPATWLDSCAGTLDLAAAIQQRFPVQPLIAADFSRAMLLAGQDKLQAPARSVVGDAMRLPFAADRFGALTCAFGVRNVPDPRRAMIEARRVLAPGGVVVILEFFRPASLVSRLFHALYAQTILPLVGRLVSGDGEAYSYLARSMRGFLTRAEFEAQLREVGFRQVGGVELTFGAASIVWGTK